MEVNMEENYATFAKRLVAKAKEQIALGRSSAIDTIEILGQIDHWKVPGLWPYPTREFARRVLGLSPKAYWMRVHAYKAFKICPEVQTMVVSGEIPLSVAALLYGKLTPANVTVVIHGVRVKTKKEAEDFLRRVDCYGHVGESATASDVVVRFPSEHLGELKRLQDVLSLNGPSPTSLQALVCAVADSLSLRDPRARVTNQMTDDL